MKQRTFSLLFALFVFMTLSAAKDYKVTSPDGKLTMTIAVGDKVVVDKRVGTDISLDKVDYKFVKQDEILAIVTD